MGSSEGIQTKNVKFTETKGNCSMRAVTRVAQLKEIKQEMLNSQKLKVIVV